MAPGRRAVTGTERVRVVRRSPALVILWWTYRSWRTKACPRERRVPFREVDVSGDAAAARDLMGRSGLVGVPVIQAGGRPIAGFGRSRIDQLFGLRNCL